MSGVAERSRAGILAERSDLLGELERLLREDGARLRGEGSGVDPEAERAGLLGRLGDTDRALAALDALPATAAERAALRVDRERAVALLAATERLVAEWGCFREDVREAIVRVREGRSLLRSSHAGHDPSRGIDVRR